MRYTIEFHGKGIYRVLFNVGRHVEASEIQYLLEDQLEIPANIENIDDEREYITGVMDHISFSNSKEKEVWNWMFDDADIVVKVN